MGKIAVITGISGQDGSYLAELLIRKKYKVIGICNPKKKINYKNLSYIKNKIVFKKIDIIIIQKLKIWLKKLNLANFII